MAMATTEERGARSGSIKRPARRQTELYFCERRSWVEGETDVHLVRCSSLVASPPRLAPNRRWLSIGMLLRWLSGCSEANKLDLTASH